MYHYFLQYIHSLDHTVKLIIHLRAEHFRWWEVKGVKDRLQVTVYYIISVSLVDNIGITSIYETKFSPYCRHSLPKVISVWF